MPPERYLKLQNVQLHKSLVILWPVSYFCMYIVTYPETLRHSSAHLRHISAHCLQCSICPACFSHSSAQASHTSAHRLQTFFEYSLSPDITSDAAAHVWEQVRQSSMHFVIDFTSSSCRHFTAHISQASKHSLHASIHVRYFWLCNFAMYRIEYWDS